LTRALLRNVGTCCPDAKGTPQGSGPSESYVESSRHEELGGHAAEFRAAAVLAPPVSPTELVEAVRVALGHAK